MKIIDRATFLSLPAGTIYAKFGDRAGSRDGGGQLTHHYFGEVRIKDEPRGESDWWSVGFTDNIVGAHDSGEHSEALDRCAAGEEIELQFDTLDSDGLYDDGQHFAVFSAADVDRLIARLQQARADLLAQSTTLSETP